ncbi:hypothetical protein CPC08DRAFT_716245 [Agrocybe pediades]|nr:hypothetical protein CPC08DRAFT_716245 [Agrocybe pediades]
MAPGDYWQWLATALVLVVVLLCEAAVAVTVAVVVKDGARCCCGDRVLVYGPGPQPYLQVDM